MPDNAFADISVYDQVLEAAQDDCDDPADSQSNLDRCQCPMLIRGLSIANSPELTVSYFCTQQQGGFHRISFSETIKDSGVRQ